MFGDKPPELSFRDVKWEFSCFHQGPLNRGIVAALALAMVALLAGGLAVATQHGVASSIGPCSPGGGSCTSSGEAVVTAAATSGPYQVEFSQESNCPVGPGWLFPWGVVLNGETLTQPSNATLPVSYTGAHLTSDSNYSAISFFLPNGTYSYTIVPTDPFSREQTGNVTVDGSRIDVQVWSFITAMGCSSTTSAKG